MSVLSLKNPGIADMIVAKAQLKGSDTVIEVGPGSGNLTVRILAEAKRCIAYEVDPRMAAETTKRVQGTPQQQRLEMILGDVCKIPLPRADALLANTPYQISSPLVFKVLAQQPPLRVCILMLQREFAMRMIASPGDKLYSRLSVNVQMWGHCSHVMKVGKANFRPPPQVESSVVRLVPKNPRPAISFDEFDGLLRIVFVRKNKTLRASFLGMSSVMDLLETNYKQWCSMQGVPVDDVPSEGQEDETMVDVQDTGVEEGKVENMDVDDGEDIPEFMRDELSGKRKNKTKKKRRGKVAELVWGKTRKILEDDTKLAEKRARMCDQGDFLKLLYEFNKAGIHFA